MSDDLKNLPCDGPTIEPDRLIPEKDYEECDTCSQASELAEGLVNTDEEDKSILDELNATAEQAAADDDAFVKSVSECVSAMSSIAAGIKAESDSTMAAAEMRGKLDELVDNILPYMHYNERRVYYSSRPAEAAQKAYALHEIPAALRTVNALAGEYSSAISIETNYNEPALSYAPAARNIVKYAVSSRSKASLAGSSIVKLRDALDGSGALSISGAAVGVVFSGALYDEYYNKLDDPMNKLFTAEERGLTDTAGDADAGLKEAAAANGMSIDSIATAKQGEANFYIRDQAKYGEFFMSFKKKYEQRVAEIRAGAISAKLAALNASLEKLAAFESMIETDIGYSMSAVAYSESVTAERDRLKSIEDAFAAKTSVDMANPGASAFAKSIMSSASCLGSIAQVESDEPEPFAGELKDTFAYGLGGMGKDSPNPTKHCYWVKFAILATTYGLLPFPDIDPKEPGTGLRYWPVGMVIPTPAKLVKVPLPIVWAPLMTVSSKFGTIVIFIGMNGVIPCPYVLYINKLGVKQLIVTLRGPSDDFGYRPSDADKGYPLKVRVPFLSALKDLPEDLMQLMLSMGEAGIEPFDEFKYDVKKYVGDAIDKMKVPEFKKLADAKRKLNRGQLSADERYEAVRSDVSDWIDGLNLPKTTLPKDPARHSAISGPAKVAAAAQEFLSMKYAFPESKIFDLKETIMPKVLELLDDPELRDEISLLPPDLDVTIDSHWEKFKALIKSMAGRALKKLAPDPWNASVTYGQGARAMYNGAMYVSPYGNNTGNAPGLHTPWWFPADDLLKTSMMTPAIYVGNPLQCKDLLEIPPVDLSAIAAVSAAAHAIGALIDGLESSAVSVLLGFNRVSASGAFTAAYAVLDKLIPPIALPDIFKMNYKKAFGQMAAAAISTEMPKIPLVAGMGQSVTIDLNLLKTPLKGVVLNSMDAIIKSLPVDLLLDDTLGFPALDGISLKLAVKNTVMAAIDTIAEPLAPVYETVRVATSVARVVGAPRSPMDAALTPVDVAKAAAAAQIKAISDNFKSSLGDTMAVSPELMAAALILTSKLGKIPYPAIGAVAAFNPPIKNTYCQSQVFRIAQPILYEDDTPPWERLWLGNIIKSLNSNALLVMFLDEFCHTAKRCGGIYENFLP